TGAAAFCCCGSFERCQWMRPPFHATRLELLAKGHLLRRKILVPRDRRPGCSRMPAVKKLLVNSFVTGSAIGWRHRRIDNETVVICSLLSLRNLVTIEAIEPLPRMGAHLKLVNDRILQVQMTFCALAARSNKRSARLLNHDTGPAGAHEI